ncbi:MAG TPA: GNAT family N-acyltransferase [Candidatus Acidoferrum sp.]|nr:GNAT family N-acyltransferase [Candidatus Acidoferrum sp.]
MPSLAGLLHSNTQPLTTAPPYCVSLADSPGDVKRCQLLRYLVFNRELREGLDSSEKTGLDRDSFDLICDHLMVRDVAKELVVGTYRLQSGYRAKGNLGYYSEQFFDFSPFESVRGKLLELGRACIHPDYRNTIVLQLLWKGIANYARRAGSRFLLGCSSLPTQDQSEALALYHALKDKHLARREFQTVPQRGCRCVSSAEYTPIPPVPRLFRAYLDISARVCGPPAIDREFKTIDFLTLLDLKELPERVRSRFF